LLFSSADWDRLGPFEENLASVPDPTQKTEENFIESVEASIGARQQTEENHRKYAEASICARQQTE
jgi:hypothetical protein